MLERFKFIGLGFATADPSLKLLSRTVLDMAHCFLIRSQRNVLRWLQENTGKIYDVEQTKKMIPLFTCKTAFGQHVCELVFGVNVFDLDPGVQIDSVKQPISRNSVSS